MSVQLSWWTWSPRNATSCFELFHLYSHKCDWAVGLVWNISAPPSGISTCVAYASVTLLDWICTHCSVGHGMVCTWALSVLIVSIATCELFHALHGLHNGDNIYMNYKYLHELQEDLATAKVFYHKQFALYGICICSKQALNVIY